MSVSSRAGKTAPIVLRWLARILSLLLVGFILLMVIGERPNLIAVIRSTHGSFLFFPIGLCVGMVLAWRWELAGGMISLLSLPGFYAAEFLRCGRFPRGPFLLVFVLPAIMFIAAWLWSRRIGTSLGRQPTMDK